MSTKNQTLAGFDLHDVEEEDHWISVSDLMAGLMMVFLFISVALMLDTKKSAIDFADTQREIYEDLMEEFKNDLDVWDAKIDPDTLSFEFQSPEVLFDQGKDELKPRFQNILGNFFPRYLNVLLKKYKDDIIEVRIEGHTSSIWNSSYTIRQAYFKNMALSQGRTRSVLEYVYTQATGDDQEWVKTHMAAVGLSSSKAIHKKDGTEDEARSRRVTFRVMTNAEEQLRKMAGKS